MTGKPLFSVWEGIFESFEGAGGDLDAFESEIWIEKQKTKIATRLEELQRGSLAISKDYPLPIVTSMMLSQKDTVSILDFGGGMGAQYLEILATIPKAIESVKYSCVDGKQTVKNIPLQMNKYENLSFFSDLKEVNSKFDIVHIGSTLQYIEDWEGLLCELTERYSPTYFVFSDLLAGDVPTFVSHQIFYDKKIPHKFLNWSEFEGYLTGKLGYFLQFKSKFIHSILNQEDVFPNFALPHTHQIERGLNAIFYRL